MAAATSSSEVFTPSYLTSTPAAMLSFLSTQSYFTPTPSVSASTNVDSSSSSAGSSVVSTNTSTTTLSHISSSVGPSVDSTNTSTTTLSHTSSRTTPHVSTSHTQKPTSTTLPTSAQGINHGIIAGGVIGGITIFVFIIFLVILYKKRRLRAPPTTIQPYEKPELHSDDYHPHRVELEGTLGKFKYNHSELPELPANEALGKVKEPPLKED